MPLQWGIGRWRGGLLCVTYTLPKDSITGEGYKTKALAIDAAKQYQAKYGHYSGIVALNTRTGYVNWVRRFRTEYDIEGRTPQGWELMTCEETYKDAFSALKEYEQNQPGYEYRIKPRKVKINPDNHPQFISTKGRYD